MNLRVSSRNEAHGRGPGEPPRLGARAMIERFPAVDILVNNLGIFEPKPFEEIPDDDWRRFFEVNVLSGVRMSRHYIGPMRRKNWGRMVSISSEWALQIPKETIHYGTASARDRGDHGRHRRYREFGAPWPDEVRRRARICRQTRFRQRCGQRCHRARVLHQGPPQFVAAATRFPGNRGRTAEAAGPWIRSRILHQRFSQSQSLAIHTFSYDDIYTNLPASWCRAWFAKSGPAAM